MKVLPLLLLALVCLVGRAWAGPTAVVPAGTCPPGTDFELPVDSMTPEQRAGYRFLVEGPRGRLPGPYKVWIHNPRLMHAAAPLGQHFTPGQSSLTEREREIAVLVITSAWRSAYPTAAHEKRGMEVGLPAATVEAMIAGGPVAFPTRASRRSTRWRRRSAANRLVSQGLYDRASTRSATSASPISSC